MRRWVQSLGSVVMAIALWSVPASAQEGETRPPEGERAQEVVDDRYGVRVPKPSGWIIGEPVRGTLAVFRAATDPSSQIEVRVSQNISPQQRENFFHSFHTSLRRSGFAIRGEQSRVEYGRLEGIETEYEVRSQGQEFRLFVFQFHRNEEAWLVTGFFPAGRVQTHRRAYEQIVGGIEFR